MIVKFWIGTLGLAVALIGGHFCVRYVLWKFGKGTTDRHGNSWRIIFTLDHIHWSPESMPDHSDGSSDSWAGKAPQWLVGVCERLFFAMVVGFSGAGVGAGTMVAWMGIKAAISWPRDRKDESVSLRDIIHASQLSNIVGLISLLFALLGGLILACAVSPTLPVKLVH